MSNCRPEDLAIEIEAELKAYSAEVAEALKAQCKQVAKETTAELKEKSPRKSGEYAKGWAAKTEFESNDDIRIVVRNKTKPQLTHLLEYGHKGPKGVEKGSAPAKPHIRPAEENAAKKLLDKVKVKIKSCG